MGVIDHDLNTDIIMSIEYIQILFGAGNDIETVLVKLAKERFGSVSSACKHIVKDMTENGMGSEQALNKAVKEASSKNMKDLFASLATPGPNIANILSDLSTHIIRDKQLYIQALEIKIGNYLGWKLKLQLIPIILYSLEIFREIDVPVLGNYGLSKPFKLGVLIGDAVIITILLVMLRGKQK